MSKTYIPVQLRRLVYERANSCCEYCLIPEITSFSSHQIDHIIAEKHGGMTTADNLALSCSLCNKNKGSDIASIDPITNEIVALFNPRHQLWKQHFKLEKGIILPLTHQARATVQLLKMNQQDRIQEREILISVGIM